MIERVGAGEAEMRQRRVAAALVAHGLQPGDRVAVHARSSVDLLLLVLGSLRRGIVPVLINPVLLPHEQAALIDDCDPALLVDDTVLGELAATSDEVDLAPWPLARPMHYTSGTTGTPKGVWSGVLSDAHAEALMLEEREQWGFAPDDVNLVCSPLFHSAPIRFGGGTLLAGGDIVVLSKFDPHVAARAIAEHRPTSAFMVPSHLQRLQATHGDALPDLSSFRLLAHAGAPCPDPLKRWAIERFPAGAVWEFYGSTEGQCTAASSADWEAHPGTVGRARQGRRVEVDADGVIWCAVPAHARWEYWNDPAKTAAAWRGDAFTVGDLGRLDAEGYLYLDGRREDLIITGGLNVYPAEVEQALVSIDGVREAVVFGVDDERWGQQVCAAVTLSGGALAPEAIVAAAKERLAPYKCPKLVVVVDELPLGPTGKVLRREAARLADR